MNETNTRVNVNGPTGPDRTDGVNVNVNMNVNVHVECERSFFSTASQLSPERFPHSLIHSFWRASISDDARDRRARDRSDV